MNNIDEAESDDYVHLNARIRVRQAAWADTLTTTCRARTCNLRLMNHQLQGARRRRRSEFFQNPRPRHPRRLTAG